MCDVDGVVVLLCIIDVKGEMVISCYLVELSGGLIIVGCLIIAGIVVYLYIVVICNGYLFIVVWINLEVVMIVVWGVDVFKGFFVVVGVLEFYIEYIDLIFVLGIGINLVVVLGVLV